jgi:hypothetical protein
MSEGSKWTPGKIVLLVVGILVGLVLLCAGLVFVFLGDKIKSVVAIGQDTVVFVAKLQKEFGGTAVFQPVPSGKSKFILAIGVDGDLTPERVLDVQDRSWKLFAESYAEHGFAQVTNLAVGRPAKGRSGQGAVEGWQDHMVSVDDLVKRTGVAAPKIASIAASDDPIVKVTVEGDSSGGAKTDGSKTDGAKNDKEGGGAGGGGK